MSEHESTDQYIDRLEQRISELERVAEAAQALADVVDGPRTAMLRIALAAAGYGEKGE